MLAQASEHCGRVVESSDDSVTTHYMQCSIIPPTCLIPLLSHLIFHPTILFVPHPTVLFSSFSSVGESSLGRGHDSEGAEDLTHLLLSQNTISFQVEHCDAIVFLISPPRHMDAHSLSCVYPDMNVWS